MTEAQLLAQVREVAKRLGYLTYHVFSSKRSEPGFPDLVLCHPTGDTTLHILELKRLGETPTLAQRRWLEALARVERVEAGILWPEDLDAWVHHLPGRH